MHITDPKRACFGFFNEYCWDAASTQRWHNCVYDCDKIGPHAICDVDGNSLELSDVKDGMSVKIRAKHVWHDLKSNYVGYDYLYTAYGQYGKNLAIYNMKT